MPHHTVILNYLEKTSHLFPNYIFTQLKKKTTLGMIEKVITLSGKEPSEAVIVFLTAVRYLSTENNAFSSLEKNDSFQDFIRINENALIELSIRRKVQGNLPERGLPIVEILSKKVTHSSLAVIELGASYGLIGRCLLNPVKLIKNKEHYFSPNQQFPTPVKGIDYYLGIDLEPPDNKWLLACAWWEHLEMRLRNLINNLQPEPGFHLIKENALHFSELESVKELMKKNVKIVILTSFMLYQLDRDTKKQLTEKILDFSHHTGAHWINQYVYVPESSPLEHYYIEMDGIRLIELPDDKCNSWKWL